MSNHASSAEVAKIVAAMRSSPNDWPPGLADTFENLACERDCLATLAVGVKNAAAAIRELKAERDDLNAKLAYAEWEKGEAVQNERASLIAEGTAIMKQRDAAQAKIAKLREALEPFANRVPKSFIDGTASDKSLVALAGSPLGDYRNAHATMEETK